MSAARDAIGDADFFLVARTDARGANAKYGLEVSDGLWSVNFDFWKFNQWIWLHCLLSLALQLLRVAVAGAASIGSLQLCMFVPGPTPQGPFEAASLQRCAEQSSVAVQFHGILPS